MYLFAQTIPANTLKSNPIEKELSLDYGLINKIILTIPAGVYGLAGLRLFKGTAQFFPANIGAWITGDNMSLEYSTNIKMYDPPYIIKVQYYNEDTNYEHTITLQFLYYKTVISKPVRNISELISMGI